MKKYINLLMGVVCALVSCTIAYADGPVKEGNTIVGHVIEKGSEAGLPYAKVRKQDCLMLPCCWWKLEKVR